MTEAEHQLVALAATVAGESQVTQLVGGQHIDPGQVKHEMVLGTDKALKEHYEVMKKNPEMEHADANMVTVAPGKTGEIIWQFTKAGKVEFACLQPGHYDAGMKGLVKVAGNKNVVKGPSQTDHKLDHQPDHKH